MGGVEKSRKKHVARTPVGEGGREGGSEKRGEGGKVVRKVGIPCWRCRKNSKKHAARAPVGEGGGKEGGEEGREGRRNVHFYEAKLVIVE